MPKLPSLSYKNILKILKEFGYRVVRQKGSHIRLHHKSKDPVTIPAHNPVARGTFRKIIRDSGLKVENFEK